MGERNPNPYTPKPKAHTKLGTQKCEGLLTNPPADTNAVESSGSTQAHTSTGPKEEASQAQASSLPLLIELITTNFNTQLIAQVMTVLTHLLATFQPPKKNP